MTQPRQIGVAAVGSRDPERARALATAVGAQLSSGHNLDVIAHPDVDAVIVSTSEHEHAAPLTRCSGRWSLAC